jgi:hypothetical protein
MPDTIAELIQQLTPDPWRAEAGFSPVMEEANRRVYAAGNNAGTALAVLREWLQRHQPCLFGRVAAKLDLLSYCVLAEADLRGPDDAIRTKIQDCRTSWTREGFEGRKSGFIVWAVSPTIANARPDNTLKRLAQRLCALYLLRDIEPDTIYHDEMFLEVPGSLRATWKWLAGVNYFCANGDGRWWQDHRFPAGMAFSVNSVGHLVKSTQLAKALADFNDVLATGTEPLVATKIDSLPEALEWAMRTINMASETVSGRATRLRPHPVADPGGAPVPPPPVSLPQHLAGKDHRYYDGFYHTDVTIPSEYFLSDVARPVTIAAQQLEFTYLFGPGVDNPDHTTMGEGRRIRGERFRKGAPTQEAIEDNPRLLEALRS